MRLILWICGTAAVLAAGAVAALPVVANGEWARRLVADTARDAVGGELTFGRIGFRLPTLSLVVDDVALAGGGAEAHVGELALGLDAGALLEGRIAVDRIVVAEPRIAVRAAGPEEDADSADSADGGGGADAPAETAEAAPALRIAVRSFRLVRGELAWRGPDGAEAFALSDIDIAAPGPSRPVRLTARAAFDGMPMTLEATLEDRDAALAGEPFDVAAALDSEWARATFEGTARAAGPAGFDGALTARTDSLGALLARLGSPLPESMADPGEVRLEARASLDDGGAVALRDATVEGAAFAAAGRASFAPADVPVVVAELDLARLDLDALFPAAETAPEAAPAAGAAPPPAAAGPAPEGWSAEPIDAAGLRGFDADIRIAAADVRYRGMALERADLSARLSGGALRLAVANAALESGGTVEANAAVDASGAALAAEFRLAAAGVALRPPLAAFAGVDMLSGAAELSAHGASRGASMAELVAALDGGGALRVVDGAVEGISLEGVDIAGALDGAAAAILDIDDGGRARTLFDSLDATFAIAGGAVANDDLEVRAPLFRASGAGRAALPARTLDYRVSATLAAHGLGDNVLADIPIPVRASGPWESLAWEVDWESVLAAVATDPARAAALPAGLALGAAELGVTLPAALLEGGAAGLGAILEEALAPPEDGEDGPALPVPDPIDLLGDLLDR